MDQSIHILHLEDDAADAELVQAALAAAEMNCQIACVQTRDEFTAAAQQCQYDIILADFRLPMFDGVSALRIAQEHCPDIPFIFVSGTIGEDAAIEGLTRGATDYVLKQKLSRLAPAVKRALSEAENRRARRRAEQALRESEDRFRRLAENAQDVIYRYRFVPQPHFEYVNPAVEKMLGYAPEEFYANPILFLQILHPDDQQLVDAVMRGESGLEQLSILRWVHKDGSTVWTEQRHIPIFDQAGNFVSIEGVARDITERRQAEERLHLQSTALQAAANGIVITDRAGSILWANPAFTRLTGYTVEEIIGRNPRVLKSGKHDPTFYQNLWETILAGRVWHGEIVNRRKDGGLYTEEMTIAPVRQPSGEISHFIAIKQDISERKQHEIEHEAIITISNALRTAPTRAEMLPVLLDQMNDLFNAEGAMLAMRDLASAETVVELGRGPVGAKFSGVRLAPGEGVSAWVIASGQPYWNNNVRRELLGDANAVACAPLIAREQTIGALWIMRRKDIAENEVRLLTAVADIAANAVFRATLHEQTARQLRHLTALHEIDMAISASLDLRITLDVLLDHVIAQLGVNAADVLLLNPESQILNYAAGRGFRTREIEHTHLRLGEGQAGAAARDRRTISSLDMARSEIALARSPLFVEEGFISHFVAPLIAKGQVKGVLEIFHRTRLDPDVEWFDFFETLAMQAAIAIDNATLFDNLQRSNIELTMAYDATIEGWSRALDLRDRETEGHTQRVTAMTIELAQALGVGATEMVHLRRGALLHDIGKMGIPDGILLKPGPLAEEEWVLMQLHPRYAYELLFPIPYLRAALDIPYCHHEKWDGTGYPRGLRQEAIPLMARIFAVVDVWDALRSERPYHARWDDTRAITYIRSQAGKHFDPAVVEMFLKTFVETRED